ncbi:AGE family epimerase/isomerase [Sphingomonas sp. PAMC 26621]|uniref:AGE family epimerase/isomerase n=1 Tax=Sphingomonas sp. PAMC 26621 TaxID=1112213 RepID=UPI000288A2F5|nr:AGE family epimerase/isomerase [Sphingomonas sp. PAMC 26621]
MTAGEPAFWIDWLTRFALPLWSEAGHDAADGSFVERLGLDGAPQLAVPRRVMVQARQIHVYATAALDGWFPAGADLAMRAGDAMIAHYCQADGSRGWAFACGRGGGVVDERRDLYAHAFVLLALASLIRLEGQPRHVALAHRTLSFLDREMADPAGGYVEQWPTAVLPRRQNPHMHLLEALLALHATGRCGDQTDRMAALVDLFDRRFFGHEDDVLSEQYDAHWNAIGGERTLEPGHHFEWIWLLTRYATATGGSVEPRIRRLLRHGLRGIDRQGRAMEVIGRDGPVTTSCRLWATMEAAKALAPPLGEMRQSSAALEAAWRAFCAPACPGGWIDRVDVQGNALVEWMPASSLYHICTTVDCLRPTRNPFCSQEVTETA